MTSPPPSAERRTAPRADAGSLYVRQLAADLAAQDYLAARGISPALARRLELGAAGHGWTGVVDQLRGRGYTDIELVAAGVGLRSGRGTVVDTFRSRVLFPAHDEQGVLVGWAGRSTPAAPQQAPRWLNSAAGDYRKAELLHGLHEGRVRLARGATPVLCEGVLAEDPAPLLLTPRVARHAEQSQMPRIRNAMQQHGRHGQTKAGSRQAKQGGSHRVHHTDPRADSRGAARLRRRSRPVLQRSGRQRGRGEVRVPVRRKPARR